VENSHLLRQFFRAVFHELFRSKNTYNLIASLMLLSVVVAGFFWQERYISLGSIAARQTPLKTGVDTVETSVKRLTDLLGSPSFQESAFAQIRRSQPGPTSDYADAKAYFKRVGFEQDIDTAVRVFFSGDSPQNAQNSLIAIMEALVSQAQPVERVNGLTIEIDNLSRREAELAKEVLLQEKGLAELRVAFRATGTMGGRDRISSIRAAIQDVEVNINTANAKIDGIRRQLKKEEGIHNARQQLSQLESQRRGIIRSLREARETYPAGAPGVISLQQELDNVNIELARLSENRLIFAEDSGVPLFEELRKQLTLEEVEKAALMTRYESLRGILSSESKRVSEDRTQGVAITQHEKDLDNLRNNYNGILRLKEQKIANRKNIEERLLRYFVLNEASLPQKYAGLGFVEFLVIGPIVAFGFPFGIAVLLVLTDSRIRTTRQLKKHMPTELPIMGVIPHYNSPKTLRVFRKAMFGLLAWGVFVFSVYATLGVIGLKG